MLGKLPPDVLEEITNPEFITQRHGLKKTYDKGCRGPLCRMKTREAKRHQRDSVRGYVSPEKEAELQRIIDWLEEARKLTA